MIYLENEHIQAHAFQTAKNNNFFCGDSFYVSAEEDYFLCVLADGLGSGKFAFESSQAVVSVVKSNPEEDVDTLMHYANQALLRKRGAAVAILKVDFKKKTYEYSCVGNIRYYMYTPSGKLVFPMPVTGYLSGRPQQFRTHKYNYEPNSNFLIHTDGFKNINTKAFLTSGQSIPSLVAQLKVKQQNSKKDDMSFIVGTFL